MTSNSKGPKGHYPCPPQNASRTFIADAEIRQRLRRCIEMSIQTCAFGTDNASLFGPEVTRCLGNARERLAEALTALEAEEVWNDRSPGSARDAEINDLASGIYDND